MGKSRPGAALVLGLLAAGAEAQVLAPRGEVAPRLEELLHGRRQGWLAADGAYSLPLSPQVVLWTFGDSIIGTVRDGSRGGSTMVNNALALQIGRDPAKATMRFYWGPDDDEGKPTAFLVPPTAADARADDTGVRPEHASWYWPFDGAVVDGTLYLFLMEIERTAAGGLMGFRQVGSTLAVIEEPTRSPRRWRPRLIPLENSLAGDEHQRFYGAAVHLEGDHLYVYGYDEWIEPGVPAKQLVIARAPRRDPADLAAWEYYDGRRWRRDPDAVRPVAGPVAAEFTVHREGEQILLVQSDGGGMGAGVYLRRAPGPAGPFGPTEHLYDCVERGSIEGASCYSAKAHPELPAPPGEVVTTYCTNSSDFWGVFKDLRLYVPRFVRARIDP